MWNKAVLLASLVVLLIASQAFAYDIELSGMKFQEGGLPSQGGSLPFDVGRNLSVLSKTEFISDMEGAWDRWDSAMGNPFPATFTDVGNQALPFAADGVNTIQFVQENPSFLARASTIGSSSEPWRIVECDIKFNKCVSDCWGDCPFFCVDRSLDLITFDTHEMGHSHGLKHCNSSCSASETIMLSHYPGGDCVELSLGTIDQQICSEMYTHGAYSTTEPANDYYDGAEQIGTLNGSQIGEDTYADGDLGGVLDNDILKVYISHQPPPEMMLEFYLIAPSDLDIAFELYHGVNPEALINYGGLGEDESYDVECRPGMWKARIFCPDYESDTWSTDFYTLYVCTYVQTQLVHDREFLGSSSMKVCNNPSGAPILRFEAVRHSSKFAVVDVQGREVLSMNIPAVSRWEYRLDGLSSGIYFARLLGETPRASAIQRLVVVR